MSLNSPSTFSPILSGSDLQEMKNEQKELGQHESKVRTYIRTRLRELSSTTGLPSAPPPSLLDASASAQPKRDTLFADVEHVMNMLAMQCEQIHLQQGRDQSGWEERKSAIITLTPRNVETEGERGQGGPFRNSDQEQRKLLGEEETQMINEEYGAESHINSEHADVDDACGKNSDGEDEDPNSLAAADETGLSTSYLAPLRYCRRGSSVPLPSPMPARRRTSPTSTVPQVRLQESAGLMPETGYESEEESQAHLGSTVGQSGPSEKGLQFPRFPRAAHRPSPRKGSARGNQARNFRTGQYSWMLCLRL